MAVLSYTPRTGALGMRQQQRARHRANQGTGGTPWVGILNTGLKAIADPIEEMKADALQQAYGGQGTGELQKNLIQGIGGAGLSASALGLQMMPKGALAANLPLNALPMDEASRMARADELNPIKAKHGTADVFDEFSDSARGASTKAKSAQNAYWFSADDVMGDRTAKYYAEAAHGRKVQDLIDASNYAERAGDYDEANRLMELAEKVEFGPNNQNVMDVRLGGNLKKIDMDGAQYDPSDTNLNDIVEQARKEGFDGVQLDNFSDAGYANYYPTTHYAIFDRGNIRSPNAAFNPADKGKPGMMLSIPAVGLIGGGMMYGDEE